MQSPRRRNIKNNFEIGNLDRKVDQFLEAGRLFVDGVSGTRPGSRRRGRFNRLSRANVKDMGRWVSDKVDAIFEDEEFDAWDYEDGDSNQFKSFSRGINSESKKENFINKRPLEAKSLREFNDSASHESTRLLNSVEDWPEESDFKLNKWQRSNNAKEEMNLRKNEITRTPKTKSFPKSRRRRI
mgnify:CR=1 FL=1